MTPSSLRPGLLLRTKHSPVSEGVGVGGVDTATKTKQIHKYNFHWLDRVSGSSTFKMIQHDYKTGKEARHLNYS